MGKGSCNINHNNISRFQRSGFILYLYRDNGNCILEVVSCVVPNFQKVIHVEILTSFLLYKQLLNMILLLSISEKMASGCKFLMIAVVGMSVNF